MAEWSVCLSSVKKSSLLLFFALTIAKTSQAYFGLSSKEPISEFLLSPSSSSPVVRRPSVSNRELCLSFHLHRRQRRTCQKESGVAETLFEAIQLSAAECQRQFRFSRWNCTLDSTRINLLEKALKETSVLYAISSSGLVHAFSRACSNGALTQCTCDESLDDDENRRTWLWGGCGDNVAFGHKFARRFLHRKKHKNNDLRAMVDQHNTEVGIRVVKELVSKKCKCHGVSGTCTTKTCWKQLASFGQVGDALKVKYENAIEGSSNTNHNQAHRRQAGNEAPAQRHGGQTTPGGAPKHGRKKKKRRGRKKNLMAGGTGRGGGGGGGGVQRKGTKAASAVDFGARARELVYLEHSPDFCESGRYSHGTGGRTCLKGGNCEELCCGRGHNVLVKNVSSSCQCKVIWCCTVECQTCVWQQEIYTCK